MKASTADAISLELRRARDKFGESRHQFDALVEEVGELGQALLQLQYEPGKGKTHKDVYKEAVQVAAMAVRVLEEGDSTYPAYIPELKESGK